MPVNHEVFRENVAAYALDALDAGEIPALEAHLKTCRTCRADLAAYRNLGDGLLQALPPQAPPMGLRSRLRQRIRPQSAGVRLGRAWSWNQFALAGSLVAILALSLASALQLRAVRQQQAELEMKSRAAETISAMLAYPGTQQVAFEDHGISGSLLIDKQRNLMGIFAWHLPPPPAGRVYQIWLIDSSGNRTSGGFLMPEPDYPFISAVVQPAAPLAGFTGLGVTTEPVGGSPAPTGPRIFGASF
jgi:anti-sigma-K factor RskA